MKPQGYSVNVNYLLIVYYQNHHQNKKYVKTFTPNREIKEILFVYKSEIYRKILYFLCLSFVLQLVEYKKFIFQRSCFDLILN